MLPGCYCVRIGPHVTVECSDWVFRVLNYCLVDQGLNQGATRYFLVLVWLQFYSPMLCMCFGKHTPGGVSVLAGSSHYSVLCSQGEGQRVYE